MVELLASCILVIASLSSMPIGAGHPDFSGTWVAVPSSAPPQVQYTPGGYRMFSPTDPATFSARFIARQNDDVLTVERKLSDTSLVTTYRLDGSGSENDEIVKTVSVASWQGDALVITTRVASDATGDKLLKRSLSFAADGSLVIHTENAGKRWTTVYKRE